MYTSFFGLTEIPFSIAPNPHFIFMSDRHREALAHLTFGLGETGGFVLLTGEVGTGKTTVSRCLLEKLPENTQVAFILNPTVSAQELLATICDELKVRYRKTGATLKTLTDKIQEKLLKNHEAGLNTVLIIDEAQHLKPEVLEQLRLLTNLETHTKKLLQVILIGQPELQQLLKRQDLRQLAQRITARYHLLPLTFNEVENYIKHRLQVAGCHQALFTAAAVHQVHKMSKGIPRLINLMCDRALLGAYGLNKSVVDKKIMQGAAAEALGEEFRPESIWQQPQTKLMLVASTATILLIMTVVWLFSSAPSESTRSSEQPTTEMIESPSVIAQNSNTTSNFDINVIAASRSLPSAFVTLFKLWQIEVNDEMDEPCQLASDFLLSCYWYKGTFSGLRTLHYPAVMKFIDEQGQGFYGTLLGAFDAQSEQKQWRIQFTNSEQVVDNQWLEKYWQGSAAILWQAPENFSQKIDEKSDASLIQWLENQLSFQQKRPARVINKFDKLLQNQLGQFQRKNNLEATGVADEKTAMLLSNTTESGLPAYQ